MTRLLIKETGECQGGAFSKQMVNEKKNKMEAAKESGTKANRKSLVHVTHFIKRKRQQKPIRRAQNRKPPEKLI